MAVVDEAVSAVNQAMDQTTLAVETESSGRRVMPRRDLTQRARLRR